MRSFLLIGLAAIVSASPAPQAVNLEALAQVKVGGEGPPKGVGVSKEIYYKQGKAQAAAAAAASAPATAQAAKRSVVADVVNLLATPAPTPAPVPKRSVPEILTSVNIAPSSCTPVDWVNTWAFTSDPACPTAIEVGTYCGFINPLDPCAAQPNAYGPDTRDPDSVEAFKANPVYHNLANMALTPDGWEKSFGDYDGSVQGAGYLSYKTLTSYDPAECAAFCAETATCTGFNIFIERDPKFNPDQCSCQPPSIAQIKCSIWGQEVKKDTATNKGQSQSGFEVVIVASNGYNKKIYNPPVPPSCSKPTNCFKKLIDRSLYCINQHTFPGPFDPSLCAAYAHAQNTINKKYGVFGIISWFLGLLSGSKGACVQFQAAYLEKAGVGIGTHCRLFSRKFTAADARLDVSLGSNAQYGCQKAYTFDVDTNAIFNWGLPVKRDAGNSTSYDG